MSLDTIRKGFKDYKDEYFAYLTEQEVKFLLDPNYIAKQQRLEWQNRSRVVHWLIRVCHHFKLHYEILYSSVNILDHYLSSKSIHPNKIQLLAIGSMLISVKHR